MEELLKKELKSVFENLENIRKYLQEEKKKIVKISETISKCLSKGNKILIFGNGGSAADSQHFAAELVGRYKEERKGFPAIALTTDTSILTAVGNDYGFDAVFARQITALGKKGDVALGISTSGNSQNVFLGIKAAKDKEIKTIAFLGRDGGKIAKYADISIVYPYTETPRIQEFHSVCLHLIAYLIEKKTFKEDL